MKDTSSESRKLTTAATSAISPGRFISAFNAIQARTSGGSAWANGPLFRMPRWAYSTAADRVRSMMPCLDAEYAAHWACAMTGLLHGEAAQTARDLVDDAHTDLAAYRGVLALGTASPVHGADTALVVTNGAFTKDAREQAKDFAIHLIDRETLYQWAAGVHIRTLIKHAASVDRRRQPTSAPRF